MKRVSAMLDSIFKLLEYMAFACGVAMSLLVLFQVIFRYFTHRPFGWMDELSRFSFIWWVLIGTLIAYRRDEHLTLDILVNVMPPRMKSVVEIVKRTFLLWFSGTLCYQGYLLCSRLVTSRSPILGISYAWICAIIPVTMGLTFLITVSQLVAAIKGATLSVKSTGP